VSFASIVCIRSKTIGINGRNVLKKPYRDKCGCEVFALATLYKSFSFSAFWSIFYLTKKTNVAISKEKKKEILSDLNIIAKDSASVVFVNFHGLSMNNTTELRKALHVQEVGYTVAKKTLTRKAFAEAKIEGEMPELVGELALVYGKDMIAPAREVYSFQKKFENKISILGGVFEGKYMDKASMTMVAQIPSLQTLRAQFLNLINSPLQCFAVALSEVAKKKA